MEPINTKTMKAKIKYINGWTLVIPKEGMAPMLFLEWISQFRATKCPIHRVLNRDEIVVRMYGTKKDVYEDALEYINANI